VTSWARCRFFYAFRVKSRLSHESTPLPSCDPLVQHAVVSTPLSSQAPDGPSSLRYIYREFDSSMVPIENNRVSFSTMTLHILFKKKPAPVAKVDEVPSASKACVFGAFFSQSRQAFSVWTLAAVPILTGFRLPSELLLFPSL